MPDHESFLERVEDVLHIHHKETTTMSTFPSGDPAADKAQADADAAQAAADEAKAAAEAVDATDEEKIAADEAQIRADEAQLAADQAKGAPAPAAEGPGTSVNNPNIPATEPAPPTPPPAPTAADAHAALDTLAAGAPSTLVNIDAVATVRAMLPAPEQPAVPAESSVPPVEAPPA